MSQPKEILSSSKIKTYDSCSYIYFQRYINKVPDIPNEGSLKGTICHIIFECLSNTRHKKNYDKIIEFNSLKGSISVLELVWKLMKKYNLPDTEEIYHSIEQMILVGLKNQFIIENSKILGIEYEFNIENKEPSYKIRGFMDKVIKKDNIIFIYDYKSGKKKYFGEEHHSNLQALIYSLACKNIWPNLKVIVRFIFLQFPNDPILEVSFEDNVLKGFQYFLESQQNAIDNFTEKDALSNLAANKGMPTDGSFSGSLICGFSSKPNQIKKDGKPYYECSYKWNFDYYSVKDNSGKILYSVLDKNSIKLKTGEVIEKKRHLGCPHFNDIKIINPLDDF